MTDLDAMQLAYLPLAPSSRVGKGAVDEVADVDDVLGCQSSFVVAVLG